MAGTLTPPLHRALAAPAPPQARDAKRVAVKLRHVLWPRDGHAQTVRELKDCEGEGQGGRAVGVTSRAQGTCGGRSSCVSRSPCAHGGWQRGSCGLSRTGGGAQHAELQRARGAGVARVRGRVCDPVGRRRRRDSQRAAAGRQDVRSVRHVARVHGARAIVATRAARAGGPRSFFQSLCVLGYCVFPLNVAAVLCFAWGAIVFRVLVVVGGFVWATRGGGARARACPRPRPGRANPAPHAGYARI